MVSFLATFLIGVVSIFLSLAGLAIFYLGFGSIVKHPILISVAGCLIFFVGVYIGAEAGVVWDM